ncbi:MAG: hypothetical protein HY553_05135 [Elusimicrobia bacterium]|nr:hypothetical protein [Elusimicrobiota bacterium]
MPIKELVYPASGSVPYINVQQRASWGAIFVGSVVALACMLSLGSLGLGIGLLAGDSAAGIGIAAGAWWLLSSAVSFYIGGWFTGRLTGFGRVSESVVHGVACWAVVTVAVASLLAGGAGSALAGLAGVVGGGALDGLRETPAPLGDVVRQGAPRAGIAGLIAFVAMCAQAVSAALGARNGTRILRPAMQEGYRR